MKYGKITTVLLSAAMMSGMYASQCVSAESGNELTMEDICIETSGGSNAANIVYAYENNYNSYGPNGSYIQQNADGGFTVISAGEEMAVTDNYNSEFSYISSSEIEYELPIWGGYFSGEKYNYCLFGQSNAEEDDSAEVIRVVKYDKSWKKVGSASVYGSNTIMPFRAGTPLRRDVPPAFQQRPKQAHGHHLVPGLRHGPVRACRDRQHRGCGHGHRLRRPGGHSVDVDHRLLRCRQRLCRSHPGPDL